MSVWALWWGLIGLHFAQYQQIYPLFSCGSKGGMFQIICAATAHCSLTKGVGFQCLSCAYHYRHVLLPQGGFFRHFHSCHLSRDFCKDNNGCVLQSPDTARVELAMGPRGDPEEMGALSCGCIEPWMFWTCQHSPNTLEGPQWASVHV